MMGPILTANRRYPALLSPTHLAPAAPYALTTSLDLPEPAEPWTRPGRRRRTLVLVEVAADAFDLCKTPSRPDTPGRRSNRVAGEKALAALGRHLTGASWPPTPRGKAAACVAWLAARASARATRALAR